MLARRPLLLPVFSPLLTDSAGGFVEILPMSQSGGFLADLCPRPRRALEQPGRAY